MRSTVGVVVGVVVGGFVQKTTAACEMRQSRRSKCTAPREHRREAIMSSSCSRTNIAQPPGLQGSNTGPASWKEGWGGWGSEGVVAGSYLGL